MFIATLRNCRLSIIFTISKANDDMVVKEPQKPIATRKEYLESKFKDADNTEKTPRTKLPIIFTNNTFEAILPNSKGEEVILNLRKAPKAAPMQEREIQFLSLSA